MTRRAAYHHGDLRAALVQAALELVSAKGVTGLSVAAAARRAEVSGAAPYRHFANRAELLSAAATFAARQLSELMREATERPAEPGDSGSDRDGDVGDGAEVGVARAVEVLATLTRVYVHFTLTHGAGFELIFADELQDVPDPQRREATRELHDRLLFPALAVTGDPDAAGHLLRALVAIAHGYAYLPRGGFMRGFDTSPARVADEAAAAVRTLAWSAAADPPGGRGGDRSVRGYRSP
ncbi:TetR/AcrR family transcriptional regulator [Parafrankia sp. EUN1f]|uniref:TetR/AcrR family transcriptional regulator n=1 Tax=Parafrankia sp. EUN1f TaxID=102897 RepID=UPI0001C449E5|nr:TetR/AcrR family transcriptional regulator [Parafrankia sp. EUN1f]EFC85529.1 transcriptional regulator, TetR family [Parafrankia sp. EUN1f]